MENIIKSYEREDFIPIFSETGIALDEPTREVCREIYKRAIVEYIDLMEDLGFDDLKVIGSYGTDNHRLGIYPNDIDHLGACQIQVFQRRQKEMELGMKFIFRHTWYPSDVDFSTDLDRYEISLDELWNKCRDSERYIYEKYRVYVNVIPLNVF